MLGLGESSLWARSFGHCPAGADNREPRGEQSCVGLRSDSRLSQESDSSSHVQSFSSDFLWKVSLRLFC